MACAHALVGAQFPEFWSTCDDRGSGMILAYMRLCMQIVAARLTDHTSSTTSVLLLSALSWIMPLSIHDCCDAGLPLYYSGEDLADKSEIISDEDLLVENTPDLWSDGMGAGELVVCDWTTDQSDGDERPLEDQPMEESGDPRPAGDDSAMAPSEFRPPKSPAPSLVCDAEEAQAPTDHDDMIAASSAMNDMLDAEQEQMQEEELKAEEPERQQMSKYEAFKNKVLGSDAITVPMPPLPCKAEPMSQEEIEMGARSEHPVSARTSNDCLQVVPSPVLHAFLNLGNPLALSS